jgi:uncharacterized protein YabE (DUF348 family)
MRSAACLALVCGIALGACAAAREPRLLLLDGDRPPVLINSAPTVQQTLAGAGVQLQPGDQVFLNAQPAGKSDAVAGDKLGTLQVRRAVQVHLNGQPLLTAADTVGQALVESGHDLYSADALDPPAGTYLKAGMAVSYVPSAAHPVSVDGTSFRIRSAVTNVTQALAEAGFAMEGLDVASPSQTMPESLAEPIEVSRVTETLTLATDVIPFDTRTQDAPDLGLGQERIKQAGVPGLALSRTKVLYQNGNELSRTTDPQIVVRDPVARIVDRGTKVVEQTASVGGASITYWLKTQMYATVYSPCNSDAGTTGKCSYGTASGLRAGKGVVAVDPALYASLNGQRLFIPGYGYAVIGDLGGGYIFEGSTGISRFKWIDLGFDDGSVEDMSGWVTVYFLAPAPAAVPSVLK